MGFPFSKKETPPDPSNSTNNANPQFRTKEILIKLMQYVECPGKAPKSLIDELFQIIDPGYKCLGLEKCGGEGFIFHVLNASKQDAAVKIVYPTDHLAEGPRDIISWQTSPDSKTSFVLKTVDPSSARFIEGIRIQSSIYHYCLRENGCAFFSVPAVYGQRSNPLLLEMEWIFAPQILDWFRRENATILTRLEVFQNLLKAVEFIHNHGIIHRDLKPDNFLIGPNNTVCIIDWSVAKEYSIERNLTVKNIAVGTMPYASPIQMKDAQKSSPADDVHCLGYAMADFILGKNSPIPYNAKDTYERRLAKYRQMIVKNPEFPEIFHPTFLKATDLEPSNRFETAGEFLEEINSVIYQIHTTTEGREVLQLADTQFPRINFDSDKIEAEKKVETDAPTLIISPSALILNDFADLTIDKIEKIAHEIGWEAANTCGFHSTKKCHGNCFECAEINKSLLILFGKFILRLKKDKLIK